MTVAGLLYLGLFAVAAAMPRHAPVLLGRWYAPGRTAGFGLAGWTLIALSLAWALCSPDWPRALVTWFGLAPLAAGIVLLSLSFAPGAARVSATLAVAMALAGLAGAGAPA